ncbi:MAG: phytoene desaturase [Anaerolineae bacterium]|nr:MAG: phytoene desaturase [Anaerolineae bacterium]
MNSRKSVIVVGAGLGGIATAAHLARNGYRVTVYEKNSIPGGRCGKLVRDGHHFDTGPTLFLMPEIFAQAFAGLGECMEDHLDLRRIDPTYHIHFDNGSTLALTSDLKAMQAQLETIERGSFGGYLRYLSEGHQHYRLSKAHLVERNFYSLPEYLCPKNLLLLLRLKALKRHFRHVGRYFKDDRLKVAFTFQDMYVGLSPYEAPAVFSLLQYAELADGIWFPIGGMYRLVEALVSIAESAGAQFIYSTPVQKIDVDNGRVTGITLDDGQQIRADLVVANADLPYVYRHLLPDEGLANRLERRKYTCSAIMFFWGVDKKCPELKAHNLFFTDDYRQSFDYIFKDHTLPDEPSFYLHAPARVDPSLAPDGQDTLVAVIPVGHIDDATFQDWDAIQKQARQSVLQRLSMIGISDLDDHIKFEVSRTPREWHSRYHLAKGATHGLSHNLMQMGYLRPRNRHGRYRNLYFVGASTHPGTGLPTVLVSARLVTERILQDAGVHSQHLLLRPKLPDGTTPDLIRMVSTTRSTSASKESIP